MTRVHGNLDMQWVVACLAPYDVAPHPNFSVDGASGAELLALIVQYKWNEYDVYAESGSDESATPRLLGAAKMSLESEHIEEAIELLLQLATDELLTAGQRVAASLLLAVAYSDRDLPEASLDILENLARTIQEIDTPHQASRDLLIGVLFQQAAMRSFEIGDRNLAGRYAKLAEETLEGVDGDSAAWETFNVSRGISWSAAQSQHRILELVLSNARARLASAVGPFRGDWERVVRAPFPAAAVRGVRDSNAALSGFLDEVFNRELPAVRKVQTVGKGDSVARQMYAALLNAELAGDAAAVGRLRKDLGRLFAVRVSSAESNDDVSIAEAIRLLRQSNSDQDVRRLVKAVRAEGPLPPLQALSRNLIDKRSTQTYASAADLAMFGRAVDLLPQELTDEAVKVAVRYGSQPKRVDDALRTLREVLQISEPGDWTSVVDGILRLPALSDLAGEQLLFSKLADLTELIVWNHVSDRSRQAWISILEGGMASPSVLAIDVLRSMKAMGSDQASELQNRLDGLQFAVAVVDGLVNDDGRALIRASDIVEETLNEVRADAAKGRYSGFSWSPFSLAAWLILKHDRTYLWRSVAECFADPRVLTNEKIEALHVFNADPRGDLISPQARTLLTSLDSLAGTEVGWFDVSNAEVSATFERFRVSHGLTSIDRAQVTAVRDVSSSEPSVRQQIAGMCGFLAAQGSDLEWPWLLLLQLSHDRSIEVSTSAADALALLSISSKGPMTQSVQDRVQDLLGDAGIARPLSVLRGVSRGLASRAPIRPDWLRDAIVDLALGHLSLVVRRRASRVLQQFDRSPR